MRTPLPSSIGKPATRALNSAGITCLEELTSATESELMNLHGFGPRALTILKASLAENGLTFKS